MFAKMFCGRKRKKKNLKTVWAEYCQMKLPRKESVWGRWWNVNVQRPGKPRKIVLCFEEVLKSGKTQLYIATLGLAYVVYNMDI